AFKPGTDDLRESPAMHIAEMLLEAGAQVRMYDPVALDGVKAKFGDRVELHDDIIASLDNAHAAVVCTEWDQVKALTPKDFVDKLGYPIVVDGRNVYDQAAMLAAGLRYSSIGRPAVSS
ncbi:MAG: UDPglucose 6-dehydrogenase, partial [Glaciecola sp.]